MAKRKYQTDPTDRSRIDEYVEQKDSCASGRIIQTSLLEQVLGMIDKPLTKITSSDVYRARNLIKDGTFKQNYKRRLIYALREFFIWQGVLDEKDRKTMKLPASVLKTKSKKDMLTVEEVMKAINACKHPRDRALIAMLWDGSNRPSELLRLTWDDLKADEYGYHFETGGKTQMKTGKSRHIRLTTSIPYIEAWRGIYPGNAEGSNRVFVSKNLVNGKHVPLVSAQRMMIELKKLTGIKNLKPYQFRPSRITHDLRNHMDAAYVMLKNWGSLDTQMMETYTNLDEDYLDQQALRAAGRETKLIMKQEEKMEVPTCPKCGALNVIGAKYCAHCQSSMNPADVPDIERRLIEMQKQMDKLVQIHGKSVADNIMEQPSTMETDEEEKRRLAHQ